LLLGAPVFVSAQAAADSKSKSPSISVPQSAAPTPEVEALIRYLKGGKSGEQIAAAEKLAGMGPKATPAIPYLVQMLRYQGLESMTIGDQMIAAFDLSANAAATALARLGQPAIEPLQKNLIRPDPPGKAVYWTSVALARMKDPAAMQTLLATVNDAAFSARADVACALQYSDDPAALEVLLALVQEPAAAVRAGALEGLQTKTDPRAVKALVAGLRAQDTECRKAAATALMHRAAPETLDALVQALKDTDDEVRNYCAQALGDIKDPRAIEPLIEVVSGDQNDLVRFQAGRALESITGQKYGQEGKSWQDWWREQKAKSP
jgi:HEAT repeat protein